MTDPNGAVPQGEATELGLQQAPDRSVDDRSCPPDGNQNLALEPDAAEADTSMTAAGGAVRLADAPQLGLQQAPDHTVEHHPFSRDENLNVVLEQAAAEVNAKNLSVAECSKVFQVKTKALKALEKDVEKKQRLDDVNREIYRRESFSTQIPASQDKTGTKQDRRSRGMAKAQRDYELSSQDLKEAKCKRDAAKAEFDTALAAVVAAQDAHREAEYHHAQVKDMSESKRAEKKRKRPNNTFPTTTDEVMPSPFSAEVHAVYNSYLDCKGDKYELVQNGNEFRQVLKPQPKAYLNGKRNAVLEFDQLSEDDKCKALTMHVGDYMMLQTVVIGETVTKVYLVYDILDGGMLVRLTNTGTRIIFLAWPDLEDQAAKVMAFISNTNAAAVGAETLQISMDSMKPVISVDNIWVKRNPNKTQLMLEEFEERFQQNVRNDEQGRLLRHNETRLPINVGLCGVLPRNPTSGTHRYIMGAGNGEDPEYRRFVDIPNDNMTWDEFVPPVSSEIVLDGQKGDCCPICDKGDFIFKEQPWWDQAWLGGRCRNPMDHSSKDQSLNLHCKTHHGNIQQKFHFTAKRPKTEKIEVKESRVIQELLFEAVKELPLTEKAVRIAVERGDPMPLRVEIAQILGGAIHYSTSSAMAQRISKRPKAKAIFNKHWPVIKKKDDNSMHRSNTIQAFLAIVSDSMVQIMDRLLIFDYRLFARVVQEKEGCSKDMAISRVYNGLQLFFKQGQHWPRNAVFPPIRGLSFEKSLKTMVEERAALLQAGETFPYMEQGMEEAEEE